MAVLCLHEECTILAKANCPASTTWEKPICARVNGSLADYNTALDSAAGQVTFPTNIGSMTA